MKKKDGGICEVIFFLGGGKMDYSSKRDRRVKNRQRGNGPLEKPGSRTNGAGKGDVERILSAEWVAVEDSVEGVGCTENESMRERRDGGDGENLQLGGEVGKVRQVCGRKAAEKWDTDGIGGSSKNRKMSEWSDGQGK